MRLSESAVDSLWPYDQRSRIRRRLQEDEVLENYCTMDPGPSAFFGNPDPDVPVLGRHPRSRLQDGIPSCDLNNLMLYGPHERASIVNSMTLVVTGSIRIYPIIILNGVWLKSTTVSVATR